MSFIQKIHPTLQRGHVDKRLKSLTEGKDIDWATAEALAMGSLLCQGETTLLRLEVWKCRPCDSLKQTI